MKKHILIFSLMYYPRVGGAEVAVKEITDRIPSEEFGFHMITIGADKNLPSVERFGNVLIHRIGFFSKTNATINDFYEYPLKCNKWFFQFFAFLRAWQLHKKYSYDAIWALMATGTGIPATLFKLKFPSVHFILTLQEGDDALSIKRTMLPAYPLFMLCFKKADTLQVISRYLADFGMDMGFRGEPRVIPNGVDVDLFKKDTSSSDITALQNEYGIKEDELCLIHIGRFVQKNGIEDIIKSLSFLSPQTKLLLVGEGLLENRLQYLVKERGVKDRVIFVGFKPYAELYKYLALADVFIRPSLSEGFGNVFIEAMTAKVPVIGTSVGGIKDFLKDGVTGWECGVHDPESIAKKVHYIVNKNNENIVKDVLSKAFQMANERYQWGHIAKDMKQLF